MKRVTIIAGYYGSGKSEICTELAIQNELNYLIDLDIINPYFRTRSLSKLFEAHGIHLVESTVKGMSNSDLPFVSGEGKIPFLNKNINAIYDLGGTESGARIFRQFYEYISDKEEIDFYYVVNASREENQSVMNILKDIESIEYQLRLPCTGLINNTHMLEYTQKEDILKGQVLCQEVSKTKNIPIVYTAIWDQLNIEFEFEGRLLTINRHIAKEFKIGGSYGKR
jgi:hypothetical protein